MKGLDNIRIPDFKYPDSQAYEFVTQTIRDRGVTQRQMAEIVQQMTQEFVPNIRLDECIATIVDVMHKRDYLSTAMIMLDLDRLAERHGLSEPLDSIVRADAGVFGVDEDLALSIATLYGPIGATNFGYLDRVKKGIIKKIDTDGKHVNTFLDDLIGATIAAACGKISHQHA